MHPGDGLTSLSPLKQILKKKKLCENLMLLKNLIKSVFLLHISKTLRSDLHMITFGAFRKQQTFSASFLIFRCSPRTMEGNGKLPAHSQDFQKSP